MLKAFIVAAFLAVGVWFSWFEDFSIIKSVIVAAVFLVGGLACASILKDLYGPAQRPE